MGHSTGFKFSGYRPSCDLLRLKAVHGVRVGNLTWLYPQISPSLLLDLTSSSDDVSSRYSHAGVAFRALSSTRLRQDSGPRQPVQGIEQHWSPRHFSKVCGSELQQSSTNYSIAISYIAIAFQTVESATLRCPATLALQIGPLSKFPKRRISLFTGTLHDVFL
jgi:hypothetical protein